ncbi:WASH complex subunit 2 [Drosophila elegans]|uniref:WASH complex subunit 2 n=1 Tax=Drosophila elegans TaxID=30023 RepID=UPI0007E60C78|nr:WASH complex subunit 2 [Drosophila elegans]
MDISADVDKIIAQAPDWNFAGDCALLALMKRISQNLHERGEKTTRNLRDFETSVRQVDISLNNATNSLRSLQFGNQFVEYRVEEVDDADLAMPVDKKKKPDPPPRSSEEMAKEFLENNLRMFRKNFEPVTIEVPDSDDEDAPVHSVTVYRAKNPYDAIPLPYIIGTKEWEEHKYAGLYDSKENSEDEKPEEFSSGSSDEGESTVSNKITKPANKLEEPHLSDSSSMASFAREPSIVSPAIKPAVQVAEAAMKTQPRPIISSQRNPHERDMFAALRQSPPSDDPPSTSSSPTSSPAFRNPSSRLPIASTASLSSSSSSPAQQPPRLFDEAVSTQTPTEAEKKPSQTKRMPVNLFNDDQFNTFMSEIVDKVKAKQGTNVISEKEAQPPKEREPEEKYSKPEIPKQIIEPPAPKRVNLFDDSPPLSPAPRPDSLFDNAKAAGAIPKQSPAIVAKKDQAKSLFDDSPSMPKSIPSKEPPKQLKKSLFDDDLEDDDFLSSFAPKTKPPEQKPLSKPKSSLFDDDDLDIDDIFIKPSAKPQKFSEKVDQKKSLFEDDDHDDVTDLFGSKQAKEVRKESPTDISPDKKIEPPVAEKKSLFDDIDDEDLFGTPKAKNLITSEPYNGPKSFNNTDVEKESGSKELMKTEIKSMDPQVKRVNSSIPIVQESPPDFEVVKEPSPSTENKGGQANDDFSASNIPKTTNLFNEDLSDDESFLSSSNSKAKPKSAIKSKEFIKPIEQNTFPEEIVAVEPPLSSPKTTDLFNEDLSDDDTFLSASKTKDKSVGAITTSEINMPAKDELVHEIKPEELPHKLPKNNEDNTADEKEEVVPKELDKSEIKVLVSESPPPDDYESNQDPIITMVADVTNKSPKDLSTTRKPADLAAAQQIMQNYSNLFSDEPPDDSEFFQTLASSGLSSLSASKIFDSEQDFFEPALPQIPSATKASPATPGDQPSSTSDYGAMCLFSDIPPEDDDRECAEAPKQAVAQKEEFAASTTRIHTIFYDDFSETARAGAVQPAPQLFSFNDEPPPADEPDRSKAKENSELPTATSPVKKLKMPNININVQALLPGSGVRPKQLRKQGSSSSEREESESIPSAKEKTMPSADGSLQHVNKSRARGPAKRRPSTRKGRKENYAKSLLDADPGVTSLASSIDSPELEPSKSRSNKALLSQSVADGKLFSNPAHSIPNETLAGSFLGSPEEADSFFNSVKTEEVPPTSHYGGNKGSDPPKSYRSFLDSPDEDDLLFSAFKKPTSPSENKVAEKEPALLVPPEERPSLGSSFLDSPDEDDSLFSAVKTVVAPAAQKSIAPKADRQAAPAKAASTKEIKKAAPKLFDDSDDDDDLFATAAVPASLSSIQTTNSRSVPTKQSTKPPAASLFSSDDDEAVAPTKIAPAKKLPLNTSKSLFSDDDDDDDDLFGGSTASKGSTTEKTKPLARPASKPATSRASTATTTATIPSSSNDNPLADLLDLE